VKLYYCYTPAHKVLVDKYFLPSIKDDYELKANFAEIQSLGNWEEESWGRIMTFKSATILKAIEENMGHVFVYSDVDIQFFRPSEQHLIKAIEGKDVVFQRDTPLGAVCAGFMVIRANQQTLKLWKELMKYHDSGGDHDQAEINILIRRMTNIKWDYLPREFFGAGCGRDYKSWTRKLKTFLYRKILKRNYLLRNYFRSWEYRICLKIPTNIVMHHANFTTGVDNKISQLEYVRSLYNRIINPNLYQKFSDQFVIKKHQTRST